jgi:hypothetical protein
LILLLPPEIRIRKCDQNFYVLNPNLYKRNDKSLLFVAFFGCSKHMIRAYVAMTDLHEKNNSLTFNQIVIQARYSLSNIFSGAPARLERQKRRTQKNNKIHRKGNLTT